MTFNLHSQNINGIKNKFLNVENFIKKTKPHILAVQETHKQSKITQIGIRKLLDYHTSYN